MSGSPGEGRLQWDCDRGFEFLGCHRGVLNNDVEDGRSEVGKHVSAKIPGRERPDNRCRSDEQQDQRQTCETRGDYTSDHEWPPVLVPVGIAATACFLGFGFEDERAIDDDALSRFESVQNFHFTFEITASANLPNLEMASIFRNEHDP